MGAGILTLGAAILTLGVVILTLGATILTLGTAILTLGPRNIALLLQSNRKSPLTLPVSTLIIGCNKQKQCTGVLSLVFNFNYWMQ